MFEGRLICELRDVNENDTILYIKKLNDEPSSSTFDALWEKRVMYLDEINPAVDGRRHGITFPMPVAIFTII